MIEIKTLDSMDDFKELTRIQQNAWGFSELDAEPHGLMVRVQKYGGLVQGLFLNGTLIGFTYGVIGKWEGEHFIYSHMTAVVKEHQSRGYGFLLKKAQREATLKLGYDTMRWNFDPLESLNAYFNIHRLGVISVEYDKNVYGIGESGLHRGLSTDRLIATWKLKSERVALRMENRTPAFEEAIPAGRIDTLSHDTVYIETPRDIRSLKEKDMSQAQTWRKKHRELFEPAFQRGFIVEEFVFSEDRERVFFKLVKRKRRE